MVIEDQVRYAGGNKLRFHHHVVRAMPGGPAGQALKDGKLAYGGTLDLADLRKNIETYLSDYAKKGRGFAKMAPIELKKLSVVAFVQDDSDKYVLNAATAEVPEAK